ncbi:MAG: hypothetical protein ACLRWQ_22505 [Flavonifractor plautii]
MQLQSGQIDAAPTFPFSLAQGVESSEAWRWTSSPPPRSTI